MHLIKIRKTSLVASAIVIFVVAILFVQCNNEKTEAPAASTTNPAPVSYNGFGSKVKWGEHIVIVSACHDCHSPKKMGPRGMELDSSKLLAGHIKDSPEPAMNSKDIQSKGLVLTNDLTTWIGPWGTSYTANLTSDETGIGNWTEEQFITALRKGKFKGMENGRNLLPPMPWEMYRNFTDDEIKAVFAYLKATPPVSNVVPGPQPPAR